MIAKVGAGGGGLLEVGGGVTTEASPESRWLAERVNSSGGAFFSL